MTRRRATRLIGGAGAAVFLPARLAGTEPSDVVMRAVPASGEKLPVIGLGTWQVFDVDLTPENENQLGDVLSLFVKLRGRVIDSSPMYGRSEQVIGALATKLGIREKLFFATKVWTRGKQQGVESMERSIARFQTKRIDLMQVHNLVDLETQLGTMREWKASGRFRYTGITHSSTSAHPEVEKALRHEQLDFLQINYSVMEPEADQRLLRLAQDRQVAVIVNRPFGGGDLFSGVRAKPLPEWAAEFDCRSWAQFFLKWIIAHPAVTCTIAATDNPDHLRDNMLAGAGRLPDEKTRQRMLQLVSAI
jgi:diketogulonate reductase-like aldo/keto reductase